MNKDNILAVADAIEQHSIADLGFNMAEWVGEDADYKDRSGHNCGTTACLAGWATAVAHIDEIKNGRLGEVLYDLGPMQEATKFFDLTEKEAIALFVPRGYGGGSYRAQIEVPQAIAVLRHLAETGEVDWSVAP